MIKLSIIIPYYNAKEYTDELLDCLSPQLTDEIEVILVDDGSTEPFETPYEWCHVIRKQNGGCSTARNMGLDNAKGEYIFFLDADDLVAKDFIKRVFDTIDKEQPDVIEFSWKSLSKDGPQHDRKLKSASDRLPNPSVCTRVFKKSFIGDTRFNEKKDTTEDEDFSRKVGYLDPENDFKRSVITDYMYFYRTAVTNSKVKRFKKGLMKTKRIVYYYAHVSKDMTWLLDEIKKEDETNEVWLITLMNEIPELKRYCQISEPFNIWGHELRGESYARFTKIELPIKAQVVMYLEFANMIGGIPSFLYYWCKLMKDIYSIVVLYDKLDEKQVERLETIVPVVKNDGRTIVCDTLILNRLTDEIPSSVIYGKTIQMCHACKQITMTIPNRCDYLINVSQAAKESWGESSKRGIVIHNMVCNESDELFLVSATRIQAGDKGQNDKRFRQLANMLNEKGIKFTWLNFSDKPLLDPPENFINMGPRINIQSFIKRADYLVQLSDQEACSMSILEALNLETPLIVTPLPMLLEVGAVDGANCHIVPFDMDFDVEKLLDIPKFTYKYDNESIIAQWKELLDKPAPTKHDPDSEYIKVKVVKSFKDAHTGRMIPIGVMKMKRKRVNEIIETQNKKKITLIKVLED